MSDTNNHNKPLLSLRLRILLSALIVVIVVLPSIGIALNNAFKAQIEENLQSQLSAYFYSVLAVTEFENNEILMPEALLENQFNVINSGLYALISDANPVNTSQVNKNEANQSTKLETSSSTTTNVNNILWFSDSFLGANLYDALPSPALGNSTFSKININNETHFIYSFTVRFDIVSDLDKSPIVTVHIVRDLASLEQQQNAFSQQLWTWLLVLILVLLAIQGLWLLWILKPLNRFTQDLHAVQNGKTKQLATQYPKELASVSHQINQLLNNEQTQRKRYRNALSDLAHSLKTPLAVIQSQQDLSSESQEQLLQINRTIQHQLTKAQSAGQNAWHLGIQIEPIANKIVGALQKIYPDTHIKINVNTKENLLFQGDESDLMELLGNLLDNACKASKIEVLLTLTSQENKLHISVEDDGIGLDETLTEDILKRGKRADTYSAGHGIGLAIVQDLLDSYKGRLSISKSTTLGGAKFSIVLPK